VKSSLHHGKSNFADGPAQQQKNHSIHIIPDFQSSFSVLHLLGAFTFLQLQCSLGKYFSDLPLPSLKDLLYRK